MIINLRTLLVSVFITGSVTVIDAQTYPCFQTAPQIPNFSGTFVKVNPANLAQVIDSDGNYTYNPGDVFRCLNVVTDPVNVNAYFFIEAMVNATIDNWDNNAAGIAQRFQPRIAPSPQNMTTDQEGYIQFRIEFRENISGLPLRNLNPGLHYRHYDIDGSTNGTTGLFTETGWTTGQAQTYVNNPTEVTSGGTVNDGGYSWVKILGSTTEHTSVSSDPEVIYTSVFGPINIVRFRMGYRFIRGNGSAMNISFREYAAEFGCFDLSNNSTLPVRLLSFSGVYNGSNTLLNWTTENEVKFREYEVERSIDGKDFSSIGTVTPQGGPGMKRVYDFTDNLAAVNGNTFYYRIKMVDLDGKAAYSQTIMIRRSNKAINGIVINPNPVVNGSANVRMTSQTTGSVNFKVIDYTGKVVLQQKSTIYPGNNTVAINNLHGLQPGVYMLQMIDETGVLTCKFSVSR